MMMTTTNPSGGNSRSGDLDRELQAEIDAALGGMSLDDLLMAQDTASAPRPPGSDTDDDGAQAPRRVKLEPGARLRGRIISVGLEDVFIEIGPKVQGVCSIAQFTEKPSVGEDVDFTVIRFDRGEGLVYLGRMGAVQKAGNWEVLAVGQMVEARCTGVNKGGLEMEVGAGMRAFMPAGQVGLYHVEDLSEYIGQSLTCEVMDVNKEKKNLVLSRKSILKREQEEARVKTLASLAVGQVHAGTVRKIMPFGAFVDIGGVDGLVHVGDMSYSRVNKVEEVLREGQQVQVQILKIEEDGKRIGLGMKQLQADPFTQAMSGGNTLVEGAEVTGRVTKIADFGAFVELLPGVEGLIHISELSHDRVNRVSQVVKPDEIVTVKVLSVDPESRRIGLSLKAMKAKLEEDMNREDDKAMAKLRAKWGSGGPKLKGGIS